MSRAPSTARRRTGSVLIVVLWASFGLVSVALLFGHSTLMSYRGADNDLAGRQAEQAIEGAVRYVETLVSEAATPGLLPDPLTYTSEAVPVGDATFWMLGRATDSAAGTVREYGIVDEASKLNLNAVATPPNPILANMVNTIPGLTDDLASAITAWIATNPSTSTASGGVTGTTVKQGPFESVEELALVSGMTREILYGEDANLNGVLDPNEDDGDVSLPADNGDGKLDPGLLEYVTVFTSEPDKDSAGTDLLNLAGTPPPDTTQLQTALEAVSVSDAPAIIASLGGTMPRSVLELLVRGNVTADDEPKVVGAIRGASVTGLVNVNTASEMVLACIPGLTTKAPDIVAARLSRATQTASMLWLKDGILDDGEIATAGPFLTGRSFQVTADIAAVGRHGRGYRRAKVIIDSNPNPPAAATTTATATAATTTSITTPRIIYRRNLAPLGWALGREVRQELALKKEVR